eukprot:CAMPEP_0119015234 /NCGR_PEP_ID=MMETSP1176-20130426/10657_1 /TAXON_ID=265551 /ORGANISM="Synedropsis recta cf, Strain CCMP1620" /LENGTH=99 /DNA_ID=CAMNT_0006968511 /DNA_START=154 /DNA_END=453 /DNA_ORIENTATION=+
MIPNFGLRLGSIGGVVIRAESTSSTSSTKAVSSQPETKNTLSDPTAAPAEEPPVAKGWLKRMAPPKGGTEIPDAKFLAVAAVVTGAGFYAWFIDPPPPS